jgi:type IV secretory pathway VirB4 component
LLIVALIVPAGVLALVVGALAIASALERGTAQRVRQRQALSPFAHELPYWQIQYDGVMVGVDLTYSVGLRLQGIDTDCLDGEDLERVGNQLHSLLRVLPPGVVVQCMHETTHDQTGTLDEFGAAGARQTSVANLLAQDKRSSIAATPGLRSSTVYLFASLPNEFQRTATAGFRRLFQVITPARHAELCAAAHSLRQQIGRALTSAGISVTNLDGDAVRALVYQLLNPRRARFVAPPGATSVPPWASEQTAREQLVFGSVTETPTMVTLDGVRHRVLTLCDLPTVTVPALVEQLTVHLPFACRVQTAIELLDTDTALSRLKRHRDRARLLVTGQARRNQEAEAQLGDLEELIGYVLQGAQRLVRLSLSVVIAVDGTDARADERLEQRSADVLRALSQMQGAQGLVEEYAQLDAFLATCPGNAPHHDRFLTCTSENAAHLLLAWQSWRGHRRPPILVENGRNYLVGLDPFDLSLSNPNAFVAGSAGSGKSVWTNYLLMHLMAIGVKALIIDVGGSYRRLLSLFGGSYFSFESSDDPALNLFYEPSDLLGDDGAPDPLRLQFVLTVLESLLVEHGEARLAKAERAVLNAAVQALYEHAVVAPLLGDLQTYLLVVSFADDQDTAIARRLGRLLRYWIDGPYRRLLNRPSTVRLTADVAAFDLKGLPDEIRPTVVLILSAIVWNLVTKDRSAKKMIVFDEVWTLLSSPASAQLLEELYRTSRKYRTSILAISQSVNDFTDSPIAEALINNASMAYLLQHQKGHEQIAEIFHLNDRELDQFRGLESRAGEYSELLVLAGTKHHFLGRVVLTPLEYWIATSHPADLAVLQSVQRDHPTCSPLQQLQRCADLYPNGAAVGDAAVAA